MILVRISVPPKQGWTRLSLRTHNRRGKRRTGVPAGHRGFHRVSASHGVCRVRSGRRSRSFLWFCFIEGLTQNDLSAAALSVARRRRSSLPKGIGLRVADALVRSCDRRRSKGRRDYAISRMARIPGTTPGDLCSRARVQRLSGKCPPRWPLPGVRRGKSTHIYGMEPDVRDVTRSRRPLPGRNLGKHFASGTLPSGRPCCHVTLDVISGICTRLLAGLNGNCRARARVPLGGDDHRWPHPLNRWACMTF